jgi:phosphoglycerate dehydrogenase-like enzyme
VSILLITHHMALNEIRWKWLRDALPDVEIIFCKDSDPTPEQLARADFILGRPDPALLKHCKNLKLLQLWSAGADRYIHGEVPEGAILASSGNSQGQAVSEHLLAMLLAMMKRLDVYSRNMSEGIWRDEGPARTIVDATTLILGLGAIGTEFAWRMKALGSHVIGVRRAGTDKPDFVDELYMSDQIDRLLPRADFLALFLPSTSATQKLMDRRRLALMKDDAYILNGGRGNAIDQEALCDLMEAGKIAGAGLDVTVPEPLPPSHRLWKTPRVLICPHVAGISLTVTLDNVVKIAAHNISAYLVGGEIASAVDFSTGYRKLPKKLSKPLSQR